MTERKGNGESLRAGAGKVRIEIPEGYPEAEGFTVIRNPIHARAVAVSCGETVILVSMELTSLQEQETTGMREQIAAETGVPKENIWICATHSFSSPHLLPDERLRTEEQRSLRDQYRKALQKAALDAALLAVKGQRPALLGYKTGFCDIVANRDVELAEGWWVDTNGLGPTDRTVSVISLKDVDGRQIALISHFGMQSSVLDQSELSSGGKAVSPDVAGTACRMVEETCKDQTVAMYLIGAAGDQAPIEKAVSETFEFGERIRTDAKEQGFAICEELASKLADSICKTAKGTECTESAPVIRVGRAGLTVPSKKIERELRNLKPVHSYDWQPDGEREVFIEGIRIGEVAFVGVQPELNCVTGICIRNDSPFQRTLVCTMVNGAAKYMADDRAYERYTYEAMNSMFGRGAAEMLAAKSIELLEELNLDQLN
ncbi:MAG: hypothetical protein LIO94_01430 [Clostridiales bacterium]|nr:hypothetical protein [Clostridiales bacterium]